MDSINITSDSDMNNLPKHFRQLLLYIRNVDKKSNPVKLTPHDLIYPHDDLDQRLEYQTMNWAPKNLQKEKDNEKRIETVLGIIEIDYCNKIKLAR